MSYIDADILLSLNEWATIMGIDLYELNQVTEGFPVGATNTQSAQCEHSFFQYSWQQDFLSRQEIAETIQKAEEAIAEETGFWPAPKYIINESVIYPHPAERYLYGAGTDKRWQWKTVQLRWQEIQGAGTLTATDLGAQAVVYSDADGDGVLDTFTVTIATAITDPTQLALFYISTDRMGEPVDYRWRIRPVRVSISGGMATFTGHRSLCVRPAVQNGYTAANLDVTAAGNFITSLQVYQLQLDQNATSADPAQGVAEWEPMPGDCPVPPCNVEVWPICLGMRNRRTGQVSIDYSLAGANQPTYNREPDRAVVNYVAGIARRPDGWMDRTWADIVAHLATAWLPVDKCGCDRSSKIIRWWRSYPTDGLEGSQRSITIKEVDDSPWDVRMGEIYAWKRIRNLRAGVSVSI